MIAKEKQVKDSNYLRASTSTLNDGDHSLTRSISSTSGSVASPNTRPSRVRIVETKPPWTRRKESISSDDEAELEHNPGGSTSAFSVPRFSKSKARPSWPSPEDVKTQSRYADSGESSHQFGNRISSSNLLPTNVQSKNDPHPQDDSLRLDLPSHVPATYTVAQVQTPGWDTPWSPTGPKYSGALQHTSGQFQKEASLYTSHETSSNRPGTSLSMKSRKKTFRKFILNNNYVPLLFRVINLAFTTSALAVAVKIRRAEIDYNVTGAIGSSPYLVIIFAPLTIVHVIWAIYLEYWGRPLGLWRTSAKLGYTLSETLFICAWSAALSLCFDNIFTSPLQCTPISSTRWYSSLPPQPNPLTNTTGRSNEGATDKLCDGQNALIALVIVGLFSYCANLVIGLFRIFEKVKYHTHSLRDP